MPEADNVRRWDDTRTDAYEVWYLTWNHPATGQGFWLRFVTEPGRGELWFARFDPKAPGRTFAIHRRFPRVAATADPFGIDIGDGHLGHDRTRGRLAGGGHEVAWDLRWDPAREPLRLLPDLAYRVPLGPTRVLSPNPRVVLTGQVVVDGETIAMDGGICGQTHLWGKRHAYAWAWGHCAELEGADGAMVELLAARVARDGVALPPLFMLVLDLDGKRHHLNQLRHVARNRCRWRTGSIAFSAWSPTLCVEGELSCPPERLVLAPYEDPDGTDVFCANTEIGDLELTIYRRSGLRWREHRKLHARGRAHFETGGRTRDPAVVHEHLLVE